MRGIEVEDRPGGDNARRVDRLVAAVMVLLDVGEVHRLRDARHLIKLAQIVRKVRIVGDAAEVALEVDGREMIAGTKKGGP
jgi:DNA-binding transcriptional regulator/RsmH inhibitor MraZ|tara:strand:+ start:59829 stop:60071 length:243 start_codon:yes stop_codon:yes gene_type:complete